MGYFTSPPMFASGLTFCRHSAERSTPIQMLSMPLMFAGLVEVGQFDHQPRGLAGHKVELLARVVGLGRQGHGLGVVVEVEVDLPGLGIVGIEHDREVIDPLRTRQLQRHPWAMPCLQ